MKKSLGNVKRLSMNTVEKYDRMANNESFAGFDGFGIDVGEGNFYASGTVASTSTEPYVLNISNAGVGIETAIVFGRNKFVGAPNFGSDANIVIAMAVAGVPYEQMLQQSASEPFEVVKTRLSSTSVTQLNQTITYVKTDSNGQEARTPITVTSYLSPDQFQDTLRDIDYRIQVDGNTHLEYPMIPGVGNAVTMSIYIQAKVNIAKPLIQKPAVTEFTKARIRSFRK
jgi:hypothetical protein